jgi:hypothetical protein
MVRGGSLRILGQSAPEPLSPDKRGSSWAGDGGRPAQGAHIAHQTLRWLQLARTALALLQVSAKLVTGIGRP